MNSTLTLTAARTQAVLGIASERPITPRQSKSSWYEIGPLALRDGALSPAAMRYAVEMTTAYPSSPGGEPVDMFALPPMVRFLFESGHLLTDAQRSQVLSGLTAPGQYVFGGGTLNHQHMHAQFYLLAQFFPNATWRPINMQPVTSAQVMATWKDRLRTRHAGFLGAAGNYEATSSTYSLINVFCALNFAQFALDPEVRAWGQAEVDYTIAVLAESSFRGSIVAPVARRVRDQSNGGVDKAMAVTQHLLWLYFGQPAFQIATLRDGGEPTYIAMLAQAQAAWHGPSPAVRRLGTTPRTVRHVTGHFSHFGVLAADALRDTRWAGDAWIGDEWAIGCANAIHFSPYGFNSSEQNFAIHWKTDKGRNELTAYHPYFRAKQAAWSTDQWSPFVQYARLDQHSAVMLADIPEADPWTAPPTHPQAGGWYAERAGAFHRHVLFRLPRVVDEVIAAPGMVVMREGSIYVAAIMLRGEAVEEAGLRDWRCWRIDDPKAAVFFYVGSAVSMADFLAAATAARPVYADGAVRVGARVIRHRLEPLPVLPGWAIHRGIPEGVEVPSSAPSFDSGRVKVGGGAYCIDGFWRG